MLKNIYWECPAAVGVPLRARPPGGHHSQVLHKNRQLLRWCVVSVSVSLEDVEIMYQFFQSLYKYMGVDVVRRYDSDYDTPQTSVDDMLYFWLAETMTYLTVVIGVVELLRLFITLCQIDESAACC
jgi:hypothetical protein